MKDVLNRGKEAAAVDGLKKSSRQVHAACHAMEAPHHPNQSFRGGRSCDLLSLFCFIFGGHTHNDTQDVIVHVILTAGSDPTSLCFLFVLVWLWFCVFCLLGCFCFWFVVFS